jgi:flagellar basal-body rod protein FlgG
MLASAVREKDASALQQLEKTSAATSDAIKAIDIARDVALNNLNNAGSNGFKATRAILQEGGKVHLQRDFSQGELASTNNPLDLGIQGDGFFTIQVLLPDGTLGVGYTRCGFFFVNSRDSLVLGMGDGYQLSPAVTLPQGVTHIEVAQDGATSAVTPGSVSKSKVAQLRLAVFSNPGGLKELSGGILIETEASGKPRITYPGIAGAGDLLSGYLESSNVDITREIVRLHLLNQWRAALLQAVGMNLR